jgi:hypothetical protein
MGEGRGEEEVNWARAVTGRRIFSTLALRLLCSCGGREIFSVTQTVPDTYEKT